MAIGKSIYRIMDTLRNILIVVFFSTIIVVCFADVAFRYAPWIKSLGWAEEILRYLNVWIILLGASVATKRKAHLSMQYFLHLFFPKHKTMITKIVYVIVLIFLTIK